MYPNDYDAKGLPLRTIGLPCIYKDALWRPMLFNQQYKTQVTVAIICKDKFNDFSIKRLFNNDAVVSNLQCLENNI